MSQRKEGCSRGQASRHWPPALPGRVGRRGGLLPSEASRGGTARAPVEKGSLPCGTRPQYGCQGHASGPATRPLLRLLLGPCTHRRGGKGKPSSTTFRLKATLQQSLGAQFPKNPHSRILRAPPHGACVLGPRPEESGCGCLAGVDTGLSELPRCLPAPLLPQPGFLSPIRPLRACLETEAATLPSLLRRRVRPPVTPETCTLPRTRPPGGTERPGRSGEGTVLESSRRRWGEGERPPRAVFSQRGDPRGAVGWGLCLDAVSPPRAGQCFRRAGAPVTSRGGAEACGAAFWLPPWREGTLPSPSGYRAVPKLGGSTGIICRAAGIGTLWSAAA